MQDVEVVALLARVGEVAIGLTGPTLIDGGHLPRRRLLMGR
jgi:hypothetical protein